MVLGINLGRVVYLVVLQALALLVEIDAGAPVGHTRQISQHQHGPKKLCLALGREFKEMGFRYHCCGSSSGREGENRRSKRDESCEAAARRGIVPLMKST